MSQLAPNWFVEQYRSNVRHIFQSKGFILKPTVTPEGRIDGKTVYWPIFGRFELQEKLRGSNTSAANPNMQQLSATLKNWDALYEIHEEDLTKMTANEQSAAQEEGGMAVGRKVDNIIFNAANDAAVAAGDKTLGNGSGAFTLEQAITACDALQNDDQVDWDGGVTAVIPWRWYNNLMLYKEFNSAEWIGAAGLGFPSGTMGKRWNNVSWLPMSTKDMLVPAANEAYGFIWHRKALGYSANYEGKVNIQWDNRAGLWTVRFDLQAVAAALYPGGTGLRRLHYASNTAITRPT